MLLRLPLKADGNEFVSLMYSRSSGWRWKVWRHVEMRSKCGRTSWNSLFSSLTLSSRSVLKHSLLNLTFSSRSMLNIPSQVWHFHQGHYWNSPFSSLTLLWRSVLKQSILKFQWHFHDGQYWHSPLSSLTVSSRLVLNSPFSSLTLSWR